MAEENKNSTENNCPSISIKSKVYRVSDFSYRNQSFNDINDYQNRINLFKTDREKFWHQESEKLIWTKPPLKIRQGNGIKSKWLIGSKSNITINCVDKHLTTDNKNKAAIIWESEPGKNWILTYQLLYSYMNRTANIIKKLGLKRGNKVCIICGSLPETIFSALACTRIGITFTIINPTISIYSLSEKISFGKFDLIILADAVYRKGQIIEIKNNVDSALELISTNIKKLIFRRIKNIDLSLNHEFDFLASDFFDNVSDECSPVELNYKFPLFSIFDYDANGNLLERFFPLSGFMLQTYTSSLYAFDLSADDIFWCNSDFSSIAGITYGIFAPLLHGISTFVYEGLPNFPSTDRKWKLIHNYKITKLLSEAYIIKALLNLDDTEIKTNELTSLKMISITGNPISELDWEKIFNIVCDKKIPLTNCFICSELGSIVFADIPGISDISVGFINTEFPSVDFDVVDSKPNSVSNESGFLIYKDTCLSSSLTLNENVSSENFFNIQTPKKKKFLFSNFSAELNGNKIRLLNRLDNKLLVAGELVSLARIKSVIESHNKVKTCRIESKSDPIFYLVPVAFVELKNPEDATLLFKEELRNMVEQNISVAAKPVDVIFIQ